MTVHVFQTIKLGKQLTSSMRLKQLFFNCLFSYILFEPSDFGHLQLIFSKNFFFGPGYDFKQSATGGKALDQEIWSCGECVAAP